MIVQHRPSPNHGERLTGPIDILLLHYTGMPHPSQGALDWLCSPESQVSSHYFVFEDGRTVALVPEDRRAWHAGKSSWGGETDINSRSIGIEIANPGHPGGLPDYPDVQIDALIELCRDIVGRHPIPPHRVLAHSDVAPGRKLDPGERFPWRRLAEAGIGRWMELGTGSSQPCLQLGSTGAPVQALQGLLALYGYGVETTGTYDKHTVDCVAAFQRHFRPSQVDGNADGCTIATLQRLIEAVD